MTDGNAAPAPQPAAATNTDGRLRDDQPAFMIGVTGHMDPGNPAELVESVRQLFRFLKHGSSNDIGKNAATFLEGKLPAVVNLDNVKNVAPDVDPEKIYRDFLNQWPGLDETPIIVLSALAPGADQIVANVVLEPEFQSAGFQLRCPLPFPLKTYRKSSSFVRRIPVRATDAKRKEIQDANHQRQAELDAMTARLDEADHFAVAIDDDLEISQTEIEQRYQDDLIDSGRRHRRYQGAGEYVAAYSHLMIAIWDSVDDTKNEEGTAGIVHARRYGLTEGLLPTTSSLPLPVEGPTLHIFTERRKRLDRERQHPETIQANPVWALRWLFAYATREQMPGPYGQSLDNADAAWQHGGLTRLLRRTQLLKGFVQRDPVDPDGARKQLDQLLSDGQTSYQQSLKTSSATLFGRIKRLADLRRRATDEQRDKESKQAHSTLICLFWLTLLAASLSHAFNHWHSQLHDKAHKDGHAAHSAVDEDSEKTVSAIKGAVLPVTNVRQPTAKAYVAAYSKLVKSGEAVDTPVDASTLKGSDPSELPPNEEKESHEPPKESAERTWWEVADTVFSFAIGLAGTLLAAGALLYFSRRRPKQHNERSDDLRAMAEGARVQLMWKIAGVGKSVSANYMQRQRGELSWIRQTISSVGMPYEQAKWIFDSFDPALQVGLLRCVFYNWIRGRGGAQVNYYAGARKKLVARIHFWHKTGFVWAIAGLWLGLLYVLHALSKVFEQDLFETISHTVWSWHTCWVLLVPAICAILVIGTVAKCGMKKDKTSNTRAMLGIGIRATMANWLRHWFGWLWSQKKWPGHLWRWRTWWLEGWEKARLNYFDHIVESLIPTDDAKKLAHSPARFSATSRVNFCIYAAWGLVVAICALFIGICLVHTTELVPSLPHWIIILSAWLLICGGLSLAWPERNLCSELAYQYGTMQTLFALAADRIEPMIDELEDLYRTKSDRRHAELKACRHKFQLPAAEQVAFNQETHANQLQSEAESEYPVLLRRIQLALYDLGTESLDENAEWLILHRARPLEPVMAG